MIFLCRPIRSHCPTPTIGHVNRSMIIDIVKKCMPDADLFLRRRRRNRTSSRVTLLDSIGRHGKRPMAESEETNGFYSDNLSDRWTLSWNSTGEIGRIGRHRAETHRYCNIRGFGQMPPDASDFPGGIPALSL